MTVAMVSEDPQIQAGNALRILSKGIMDLETQLLTSSHAGRDKQTLEGSLQVAKSSYLVLVEMLKQMNGQDWDRVVVEKDWFGDSTSSEGYAVFGDLVDSTRTTLERALQYSINTNLTGRFVRGAKYLKDALEDAAPSAPVAYGLIALIAVAVIAIVVLR